MQRFWLAAMIVALTAPAWARSSDLTPDPAPPHVDKQKLENYLRYAEGFSSSVKFQIDEPSKTAVEGYYRVLVHLSLGENKQDKIYYLTRDGQHVVAGQIWDLDRSPFVETLDKVPTDGPAFGPADAKVKLVVFSDFQCPYCREFARTLRENVPQKYPHDVRVVFKDFPIDSLHPWARAAAEAGHCFGEGKPEVFWAYHDWLFQHQGEMTAGNLREKVLGFAKEHSLEEHAVAACLDEHKPKAQVEASLQEGRALEVDNTPTLFLNGRAVKGAQPWKSLDTLIQMELNRPAFAGTPMPPSSN